MHCQDRINLNRGARKQVVSAHHEAFATGYEAVETAVSCHLTRFRVRSALNLLRFYLLFRRIRDASREIQGLITTVFVVENYRTFYILSLWANVDAILEFNARVMDHIASANWSMRRLARVDSGPLLWSAQFRLSAVSPHNFRWEGVDIESHMIRPGRLAES
jgi:hypothetical protein